MKLGRRELFAAGVAAVGSTAGASTDAEWPLVRYDAGNSGYGPSTHSLLSGGQREWTTTLRGTSSGPVITDGTIVVGTDAGTVHAFTAATGDEEWTEVVGTGPTHCALVGDTVYATVQDGSVVALDVGTGSERWRVDGFDPLLSPIGSDGEVLVFRSATAIVAVEVDTGREAWRFELGVEPPTHRFEYSPTIAADRGLVFVTTGTTVSAIDIADGSEQWSLDLDWETDPTLEGLHLPVYSHRTVLIVADTTRVALLDAVEGTVYWDRAIDGPDHSDVPPAPPVIADRDLFVATGEGIIKLQLDPDSDEKTWLESLPKSSPVTAMVAAGTALIVSTADGHVYTRTSQSTVDVQGGVHGNDIRAIAVTDDRLYLGDGELLAIKKEFEDPPSDIVSVPPIELLYLIGLGIAVVAGVIAMRIRNTIS